ncbi:M67 family metallopeptidase [Oryzomonas sagensis]|uniref:M67 family metallopeptidase n=1 Tax=Oryzomonas sagensis TaxID=2603857 RepID=A0ABQ6TU60_9BACT|nr:M67 family metallopeptidase [Oryzomonas sagensis]KAB0672362.1 M67 family metallopeptidase [Oryzomonas sagensis]
MLKIPASVYDDLIAHAREGFPLEVCGILGGTDDTVSVIYRMTNSDASNEHFMMEPREQFSVVKDLRAKGLSMLAVYHSHPETPARPSQEDIKLALTPLVSYVIISLADPTDPAVKSYKIHDGNVEPEPIETIKYQIGNKA